VRRLCTWFRPLCQGHFFAVGQSRVGAYVQGSIQAGLLTETTTRLVARFTDAVSRATDTAPTEVVISLREVSARLVMEGGQVLLVPALPAGRLSSRDGGVRRQPGQRGHHVVMAFRDLFGVDRPPVVLITGGNKGLGLETGRQLAQRGLVIVVGSRDLDRGRDAAASLDGLGPGATAVQLDVTDPASVASAGDAVSDQLGRLDVLINNAGIIVEARPTEVTAEQMRPVFETNVFGPATVTTAMLPLLAASPHPRIVNVTSTTGSLTLTANGADFGGTPETRMAYAPSKAALTMLTLQYARAFAAAEDLRHIKVNAVTPGYTATDLNHGAGRRTVEQGAQVIVAMATIDDDGPSGSFVNHAGTVPW